MTRLLIAAAVATALACSSSGGENTGQSCEVADDCYPGIDHADLRGEVECLDRVEDGYCTHRCQSDDDCCAVPGECATGIPQVCAPFENSTITRCFLSCENDIIGEENSDSYCRDNAHPDFLCRSTGGGGGNRRVCVPGA
jgi:hypothetical protein